MANIVIDIASEFTGAKAFKQADSATDKLTKNVKKLAATVGLAYSTTRVLAYAKSSVKAAAADQKAQQQLALALKNVGLERDAATSEALIQRLQSEYGIVDDLLRPAYQALAIATRDTAESQRLLNLSLDISAATGKDLGSVTAALSKAYLGNNTALTRLGVGISKADLKTKSFYDITTDLQDTFKGSATAAANTFQGSMDKLGVASANVSEIIGTSLIDALKGLGNQDSVDNLASSMERVAQRTGDVIRGVGVLIGKLKQLPGMPDFSVLYDISYLRLLEKIGSASRAGSAGGFPQGPPSDLTRQFPTTQTKTDKTAKETLKINKESLKLAKARATFDLQKIQIEAALKGKISAEDAIRLKLMKAIEDENIANIDKYQKALEVAQTKTKELADALAAIKASEAANPFAKWADYVKEAIELTNTVAQASLKAGIEAGASLSQALSGARYAAQGAAAAEAAANAAAIAGAYGSAAAAANKAAADQAAALAAQTKAAQDALVAGSKAAQDALAAQTKAAQDAAAAQAALLTAGSAEQKAALEAQLKAQLEFLAAQSAAQMAALKAQLAAQAAADKELLDASQAAAEAAFILGTNDSATRNAAILAAQAAAQAAASAAALAAAEQASASSAASSAAATTVIINVEGSVIAENDLATIVNDAINNSSVAGNAVGYNRTATTMAIA